VQLNHQILILSTKNSPNIKIFIIDPDNKIDTNDTKVIKPYRKLGWEKITKHFLSLGMQYNTGKVISKENNKH